MTTITLPRALIEQALEVINDTAYGAPVFRQEVRDTITTLRAALAQPDPQDPELSAALGWPGGISDPVLDRKVLLQQVAALRAALAQQAEPVQEPITRLFGTLPVHDTQQALAQQAEPVQDRHGACPTHCCPVHGCKYMHDDCPVVSGAVQPVYPRNNGCESCADEAEPLNLSDRAVQRRLAAQWGYVPAAQTEPAEPVAWVNQANLASARLTRDRGGQGDTHTWSETRSNYHGVPLCTAPPQRKPLTEEEIESCRQKGYAHAGLGAPFDFGKAARAIERAHGIKE